MTTTFHPSLREYFKRFGIGRTLLIVGLLIFLFYRTGLGGTIIGLLFLAIFFAIVLVAMKRRTLEVTDTHLHYFTGLLRKEQVALSELSPVVYLPSYSNFSFGRTRRLIIARKNKPFLVLSGMFWSEEGLPKIVEALEKAGVTVTHDEAAYNDFSMTDAYGPQLSYFYKVPKGKELVWTIVVVVVGLVLATLLLMVFPDIADALDSFWYQVENTFRSLFRIPS